MVEIPLTLARLLTDYLEELAKYYHLGHVILFGSQAQGAARRDSDIDLAVFSTDVTDDNEIEIMADMMIKAMPYKLNIQPLVFPLSDYDSDNDFIQNEIIARGIELAAPAPASKPSNS